MASAYDSPPQNPQISFGDHLTDTDQRKAVERSVATHIAHSAEAAAQARTAETQRAKLVAALQAPFMKQIRDDPEATKALDELRTQHLIDLDSANVLRPGEQRLTATEDLIAAPSLREVTLIARRPPYDYTWSWFRPGGHPPHNQALNIATGEGGIDARSGSVTGGASGFVEAHAGFGVVLRTDRPVSTRGNPFSKMRQIFHARAVGVGANATSEGGMDLAAFEEDRLVGIVSVKLWRRRVSANPDEEAHGETGPLLVGFPGAGLTFRMNPGHQYTFNVGMWVFTDRSPGVGAAAAQSVIQGTTSSISAWLTSV